MRFSQRQGFEDKPTAQMDEVNHALRIRLWNALTIHAWNDWDVKSKLLGSVFSVTSHEVRDFVTLFWDRFLNFALDEMPTSWQDMKDEMFVRLMESEWYRVYDFIEFVIQHHPNKQSISRLIDNCNTVLDEESSGYKIVNGMFVPVMSPIDIGAVEVALNSPLEVANTHLLRAVELLAEKPKPDCRNSIKESISAVEAVCKAIAGMPTESFGRPLEKVKEMTDMDENLYEGFKKLYWYTCGSNGIRHALMDESNLDLEDAKYFLVSCSAFVNYLVEKANKANIELK